MSPQELLSLVLVTNTILMCCSILRVTVLKSLCLPIIHNVASFYSLLIILSRTLHCKKCKLGTFIFFNKQEPGYRVSNILYFLYSMMKQEGSRLHYSSLICSSFIFPVEFADFLCFLWNFH